MLAPTERAPNSRPSPLPSALLAAELGPVVMADDPCEAAFSGVDPTGPRNYYRARYYDPKIGRFISEDPIGFKGGVNFYDYVHSGPTIATDPFGLVTFVADPRNPASAADITTAYARQAALASKLTPEVKAFLRTVYGVDIAALLDKDSDVTVGLARQGKNGVEGSCLSYFDVPTLNLDQDLAEGADKDLFDAALLHELTHYVSYWPRTWWRGDYPLSPEAAAYVTDTRKAVGNLHAMDPFLTEYYQFGRRVTYR